MINQRVSNTLTANLYKIWENERALNMEQNKEYNKVNVALNDVSFEKLQWYLIIDFMISN